MRLWEEHGPSLRPTTHNVHRLFITALVVASKTNDGATRRAPPRAYRMLTICALISSRQPHANHMPTSRIRHPVPSASPPRTPPCAPPLARLPYARADTFHPNRFMAKCGGITNAELNKLEVELCERLRWDLAVQPDELIALTSQLQGDVSPDDDSSAMQDSPV